MKIFNHMKRVVMSSLLFLGGVSLTLGATSSLTYTEAADAPQENVVVSQTYTESVLMTITTNNNDGVGDENMYGQTFLSPADFDLSAVSFSTPTTTWTYDPDQVAQLAILEDTDDDGLPDVVVGDVHSVAFPSCDGSRPWKTFTLSEPVSCNAETTYAFVFTLVGPISDNLRVQRDRTQTYGDGEMISTTYPAGDFPALPISLKTGNDMLFVIQMSPTFWNSNPVVEVDAVEDVSYTATLSDNVSLQEEDNPIFSKLSGPSWLNIATDGSLSGTPDHEDVGLNTFSVEVAASGTNQAATLEITVTAPVVNWDMESLWGISESGFDSAITAAHDHFDSRPNDTIIIHIAAGTHEITGADGESIDLRNGYLLDSEDQGRLIFQGAGMDETVLVFVDTNEIQIDGNNVAHVTFRDMHCTRAQYTVSQGTVVEVGDKYVDLDIHDGFPMPNEIVRWADPQGLYMRRYTASKTDPLIITDGNNDQVSWETNSYALATNDQGIVTWRMFVSSAHEGRLAGYQLGEYVGIKSKHTGNNWFFTYSDDLVFENIKYTHDSRGVFRQGTSNVRFSGCRFERAPPINGQTPCLLAPGGGPQFGQPSPDPVSRNMVIENCYIEATGDDCTAFFNVNGGVVRNCVFRDSFARGILMTSEAVNIRFEGSTLVSRGPILGAGDAAADALPPIQPTGLSVVDGSGHCRLSWNANTEEDFHYYQIYRKLDGVWWEYAITTDAFYDDLWALNGIIHEYYMEAVDFSGNHSPASETVAEPSDYTLWIADYLLSDSNALETADLEPDGINNYLEYALGGNPTQSDSSVIMPTFAITSEVGADWMEYVYRRRNDYTARGISYMVETSTNLLANAWSTDGVVESGSEAFDDSFDLVTNRVPMVGVPQQYMRLRVE